MRQLEITRAAEADVLEIWSYLFERSEQAADRVVDEIAEKYDLLLEYPQIGRVRDEFGVSYRSLAVGNYVIIYEVTPTKLYISRIVHGARDLSALFGPADDE